MNDSLSNKRKALDKSALPPAKKSKIAPEKLCASCHQPKTKYEFSIKQRKQGVSAQCKPCVDQDKVDGKKREQQQQMLCCAVCKANKSIESFYKGQRKRGAEARCIECSDKESQEAARQRQEVDRERREVERKRREVEQLERNRISRIAYLKEQAMLMANGPQIKMPTFEVPSMGTLWGDRDGEGYFDGYECPALVFHESTTTLPSLLVGSYDIVFYYSSGNGDNNPRIE